MLLSGSLVLMQLLIHESGIFLTYGQTGFYHVLTRRRKIEKKTESFYDCQKKLKMRKYRSGEISEIPVE